MARLVPAHVRKSFAVISRPEIVPQVIIHVARIDAMSLAVFVHILKQFRSWQVAAVLEDTRQLLVADDATALHAALAAEVQRDLVPFDRDVTILQRGQAEAVVLSRVFSIADAGQRSFHQAYYRREHFLARQIRSCEVLLDPSPNRRQRPREIEHVRVFVFIAHRTPSRMIAILFAPASVAAGRLKMAVSGRANPHVGPRRRNDQRFDSREHSRVGYLFAG